MIQIKAPLRRIAYTQIVTDLLHSLALLCGPSGASAALQATLVPGLLLAGAAGSIVHCGPMCGPFVLGQVSDRLARLPATRLCELRRLQTGLLLPYHAGRLCTYALLGAAAGFAGNTALHEFPGARVSGLWLLLAAGLFLMQALKRFLPPRRAHFPSTTKWARKIARLAALIRRCYPNSSFLIGVCLGFLPCGFLYSAITIAAASGSALLGALGMLAFGAGTVPALGLAGVSGAATARRWNRMFARASPFLLGTNAALLGLLGWQLAFS